MTPALLYSLQQRRRRKTPPDVKAHESVIASEGDMTAALMEGKIYCVETPEAVVLAVPDASMHLVEDAVAELKSEKPVILMTEDGDSYQHGETDILCEMTFSRLVQLTRQNGKYKVGGLKKVGGRWVNDPLIPGRAQNARFVITQPGQVERDTDGMLIIRFRYSSRPDRNTTGGSHSGHIKFLEPKGFFKRMLRKFLPARQIDQEVEVNCSCLAPGSLVLMGNGTYLPIEQVKVGDKVYTHKGNKKAVTRTVSRSMRHDEQAYFIRPQGFPDGFVITDNHPVLALRGSNICECGCGQQLPVSNLASPELMLRHRVIQGHGGAVPGLVKGEKRPSHKRIARSITGKRKTTEQFVDDSIATHGDKYSYGKSVYTGARGKVTITCPSHGDFEQTAIEHQTGRGCQKCAFETIRNASLAQGQRRKAMPKIPHTLPHFEWVKVGNAREVEWLLSPWLATGSSEEFSHDFIRLVGYYAAEGSICKGTGVQLTFNINEWDTLAADAMHIAQAMGMAAKRTRPKNASYNWCNVTIRDKKFQRFCIEHVGRGSWDKVLSDVLMSLDEESSKHLLGSMAAGDGSIDENGRGRFFSVSKRLVTQFATKLAMLKLRSSVSYAKKTEGSAQYFSKRDQKVITLAHKPSWQVSLSPEASDALRPFVALCSNTKAGRNCKKRSRSHRFAPVEGQLRRTLEKSQVAYRGVVHDLTVADDESFIVHGVAVHNCQDFKYRFAKLLSDQGAGAKTYGIADQYPLQTNPTGKLSLCKHLASVSSMLQMSKRDEKKLKQDFGRDDLYVRGRDKSPGVKDGAEVEDL